MLAREEFTRRERLLTERLREVAGLVAIGKTNKEIAAALMRRDDSGHLSVGTVRRCVEEILLVFEAANRAEVAHMYGRYDTRRD